jgi:hypothetical protein
VFNIICLKFPQSLRAVADHSLMLRVKVGTEVTEVQQLDRN